MPQFDSSSFISQLFWFALCFSVLYFFMSTIYLPRIRSILKERKEKIENDHSTISELELKIEELKINASKLRDSANSNYKNSIDHSLKQTVLNREEAINNIKKKIEKINAESEGNIIQFIKNQQTNCELATTKLIAAINKGLLENNLEQILVKTETKN